MSKTPSVMVELGTRAPHFSLINVVDNQLVSLPSPEEYAATVIMFICNHCPYVKHISKELRNLANDYLPYNVRIIAINSNDINNYPDDSPDNMRNVAQHEHYPFPYLFDESQQVAKAYKAACTPDFFIYDANMKLAYRGQFDDSRPGNQIPVSGLSVRHAIDCLLGNRPVNGIQVPSLGCNIKWKVTSDIHPQEA